MSRWTNVRCGIAFGFGCPWKGPEHVGVCLECWSRWDKLPGRSA